MDVCTQRGKMDDVFHLLKIVKEDPTETTDGNTAHMITGIERR